VTIGIALFPDDGDNFDELAKHADAALYAAKNAGRNRFHYFTRELGVAAHLRLQQEQALKAALGHGEIFLEYQPKVDFSSDQMVGVEALVRWNWSGQRVPPAQFIPLAEESGHIIEIGRHILRSACQLGSRCMRADLLRCRWRSMCRFANWPIPVSWPRSRRCCTTPACRRGCWRSRSPRAG
jgi:predicted signal transduction protein with EAL and GGDEF domain